jgi:hypothetical protein
MTHSEEIMPGKNVVVRTRGQKYVKLEELYRIG